MAAEDGLDQVLSDLEEIGERAPVMTAAAVYVLKNEMARLDEPPARRELLYEGHFVLPGGAAREPGRLRGWLSGRDREAFRDRCDRAFWRQVVPVIEREFGDLAELVMNTVNEAIINYAEYSFKPWALGRRVVVQLFRTEGELAYAIVRPRGLRLNRFDPLALKERSSDTLLHRKRGWGHTLLMQRALFVSFDRAPRMRGMMIIMGDAGEGAG